MGGMWGLKLKDDRILAKKIFQEITNSKLSQYYKNYKTADQDFLADYVYKEIAHKSVIHDSYNCMFYRYSSAWPTIRKGNCYVGSSWFCNETLSNYYKCPEECRPKEHPEWIYC